jgi:hypothetical protein
MNCQDVSLVLENYRSSWIGEEVASEVEKHLLGCESCRRDLARLDRLDTILRKTLSVRESDVPGFTERVMERVGATKAPRPAIRWQMARVVAVAAGFVLALGLLSSSIIESGGWGDAWRPFSPEPGAGSVMALGPAFVMQGKKIVAYTGWPVFVVHESAGGKAAPEFLVDPFPERDYGPARKVFRMSWSSNSVSNGVVQ